MFAVLYGSFREFYAVNAIMYRSFREFCAAVNPFVIIAF